MKGIVIKHSGIFVESETFRAPNHHWLYVCIYIYIFFRIMPVHNDLYKDDDHSHFTMPPS